MPQVLSLPNIHLWGGLTAPHLQLVSFASSGGKFSGSFSVSSLEVGPWANGL